VPCTDPTAGSAAPLGVVQVVVVTGVKMLGQASRQVCIGNQQGLISGREAGRTIILLCVERLNLKTMYRNSIWFDSLLVNIHNYYSWYNVLN